MHIERVSESHPVVSDSLRPHGLYSLWNSPGQNTRVGSLSLLQWIFPTQGSNPGLSRGRQILYQLSHQRSPEWVNIDVKCLEYLGCSMCSQWVCYYYYHCCYYYAMQYHWGGKCPWPRSKGNSTCQGTETAKGMVWSKELKKGGPGAGEMVNKENLKGRGVETGCQSILAWLYPLDMEQARLELPAPGDDGPVKNWVTTLHTPAPPPLHCTLRLYSLSVNHKWLNEWMG